MQQGDSIGIFNLLSIRRSSDSTSTFSNGFSFISQSPASGNTLVFTEVLLLTGEQCSTHWDSIHGSGGSGHPHCPHRPWLQGSASHRLTPSTPTFVPFHPCWTLSCFSLPLTTVQILSSLGSDTDLSFCLSLSFFLDVLTANPTQLYFREVLAL